MRAVTVVIIRILTAVKKVLESDNAAARIREISVKKDAGVKKGDADIFACVRAYAGHMNKIFYMIHNDPFYFNI